MANPTVPEMFQKITILKTKKEKIAYMQEMGKYPAFKDVLRINFDDEVVSLLPEGEVPYRRDDAPAGYEYQTLSKEYRRFTYFFKGGKGTNLSPLKRESMWIDLLESLGGSEADLMVLAKDKRLKYKGVTKKLVQEAFPNLLVK
jgi:hypothetical protein